MPDRGSGGPWGSGLGQDQAGLLLSGAIREGGVAADQLNQPQPIGALAGNQVIGDQCGPAVDLGGGDLGQLDLLLWGSRPGTSSP